MAILASLTTTVTKPLRRMLGYDAVQDKKKRTAPRSITRSEDKVLTDNQRKKLQATARDIRRNFSLCQWMINKHLDFVSGFQFQALPGVQ